MELVEKQSQSHLNEVIARNAFEAGNVDYIKIAHKNLGSIKKIKIWHDEKWLRRWMVPE